SGAACTIDGKRFFALVAVDTFGEQRMLTAYVAQDGYVSYENAWLDFVTTALSLKGGSEPLPVPDLPALRSAIREPALQPAAGPPVVAVPPAPAVPPPAAGAPGPGGPLRGRAQGDRLAAGALGPRGPPLAARAPGPGPTLAAEVDAPALHPQVHRLVPAQRDA